ncbi:unnamed protein product, partial [Polarella glacialis]
APQRGDREAGLEQLSSLGRFLPRLAGDHRARAALGQHLGELLLRSTQASGEAGPAAGARASGAEVLCAAWPQVPATLRPSLLELINEAMAPSAASLGMSQAARRRLPVLMAALLDASAPEELQALSLRVLRAAVDPLCCETDVSELLFGSSAEDGRGRLSPKVINAALLRAIPRQPLVCLDILGALALKEDYRGFFCSQGSLLQFLAHCCKQPEGSRVVAKGAKGAAAK